MSFIVLNKRSYDILRLVPIRSQGCTGCNSCPRRDTGSIPNKCMHIDISGSHMDLTDALRDHVHNEFKKLEKVLDPSARIVVEIGKTSEHHKQGNVFKAEAKIIEPKAEYFSDVITTDLYTAINTLSDEIFQQVTHSKKRHRVLMKKGQAIIKKLLRLN